MRVSLEYRLVLTVFGLAVFVFIYGGMLRANAYRWRYLAKSYAVESGPIIEKRNMRSAVLVGLGAFNSLKGILTIAVHENGVSFRVMPLFSLFHEPLFVPYSDIRGWRTTWYLDAPSSELEFRRAPEVKMVLPTDDAEWIRSHAGHEMFLRDVNPPQGNAGRGWHAFTVAYLFASLAMVGWLAAHFLLK
jgi:hypothetical protein